MGWPACRCAFTASTAGTSAISTARAARYQRVRRLYRPFVNRYVALSQPPRATISSRRSASPSARIAQIYNGVDTARFRPSRGGRPPIRAVRSTSPTTGWSGPWAGWRRSRIRSTLARAFVARGRTRAGAGAAHAAGHGRRGPLRGERRGGARTQAGVRDRAWFAGERADVPEIMRGLDCFVLPSLAEGVSNTILEAMASGLPVVATRVGGNPELIEDGMTGTLVPPANSDALARRDARLLRRSGAGAAAWPRPARQRVACSGSASTGWSRTTRTLYDAPRSPVGRPAAGDSAPCRGCNAVTRSAPRRRTTSHVRHRRNLRRRGQARRSRATLLARMNETQHHRGPDEGGLHVEPGVGLGHRRLSIIDSSTGQQPLYNEDGSVVVVYNGEIYNYQELIPELHGARPRLPHQERHRGHRPRLGGMGRGLRRALPRHVRVRAVGPQPRDAVPRPRPARREAAVLRAAARRHARLRLRAEVAARARRPSRATSTRCAVEEYFALGYVPEPRTIFTRRAQAAARAHADDPARPAGAASRASTGTSGSRSTTRSASADAQRGAGRAPARIGPAADDLRGSARRVPVRRRGLERGRRDDGRAVGASRSTPARSRSPTRRSTSRAFAQQVADRYRTRHFVDTRRKRRLRPHRRRWRGSTTSRTPTARRSRPTASASSRAST